MDHAVRDASADFIESLCAEYQKHNQIDPAFYERYRVKRGLRNADGTGVMAGVTQIGNVAFRYTGRIFTGQKAGTGLCVCRFFSEICISHS